jgi:hypothetical protein
MTPLQAWPEPRGMITAQVDAEIGRLRLPFRPGIQCHKHRRRWLRYGWVPFLVRAGRSRARGHAGPRERQSSTSRRSSGTRGRPRPPEANPSSFDAADRLPEEWRRSNPEPMGRRANKRWNLPRVGDLSRCRVGKRCSPRIHDALMAVAMIKPETWVSYA